MSSGSQYSGCLLILFHVDSVSRSPLYSIYGETIAGVPVLRAFGASSKLLRDMLQCVDTVSATIFVTVKYFDQFPQNSNPYYWMWGGLYPLFLDALSSDTHVRSQSTDGFPFDSISYLLPFSEEPALRAWSLQRLAPPLQGLPSRSPQPLPTIFSSWWVYP